MTDYLETKGRIFDIQRFSVHDGPGIRTIVFLKGCMFRCRWCCNPESQERAIQVMKTAEGEKTVGRDVTAAQVLEEVVRDEAYYRRSGGGLTLSGGEALLQPAFAKALFRGAKEQGINTAIESTGAVAYDMIEDILPWIDYFLMDVKHMNPEKHRKMVGQDNHRVLENAVKIARQAEYYAVRVPVIPGFNDTPSEIADIAKFAAELKADRLHLLPYHRLGADKYAALGRTYSLPELTPPSEGHMAELLRAAEQYGVPCQIGG